MDKKAKRKILVIDDEDWLREMINLALTQEGYEVAEAVSSEAGVRMAWDILPDLIICDVNMGKTGEGYVALEKLRGDQRTAATPFILMTGLADARGMRHGMEMGADDYLPKPFRIEELYAAVDARLKKVQTVREDAERKLTELQTQISLMLPHEMRTPLNGVLSNAELLAESAANLKPEEVAEMGREMAESGRRLERLIENFLIHAQLEIVGKDERSVLEMRKAVTRRAGDRVREVSVGVADLCNRMQDLKLQADDGAAAIQEQYFKKVVGELVQNAFHFSEPGKPVNVKLGIAGDELELVVKDQGRGFSTEHLKRIDAYMQFERRMQDTGGLGLGLTISRKLVEIHGGTLEIRSQPGEGAIVTVRLPLARES